MQFVPISGASTRDVLICLDFLLRMLSRLRIDSENMRINHPAELLSSFAVGDELQLSDNSSFSINEIQANLI